MNVQNLIVRRLLTLALTCGLLATSTPAAQAQPGTKERPVGRKRAVIPRDYNCGDLLVVITGSLAAQATVSCTHAYVTKLLPDRTNPNITPGKPAVFILQQPEFFGPDCTITIYGGGKSAVLAAQQNYCGLEAGGITASVVSGDAALKGSAEGSYAGSIPGIVWFTFGS